MAASGHRTVEGRVIIALKKVGEKRRAGKQVEPGAWGDCLKAVRDALAGASEDDPTLKDSLNKVFYLLIGPEAAKLLTK
jgi:hypothetical protein